MRAVGLVAIGAAILLLGALGIFRASGLSARPAQNTTGLPDFLKAATVRPQAQEAYQAALEHGEAMVHIPCYCGCVAGDHRNLKDCYIRPSDGPIIWNEHAAHCDICIRETLEVVAARAQGLALREIRLGIERGFQQYAPPTDTPPLP